MARYPAPDAEEVVQTGGQARRQAEPLRPPAARSLPNPLTVRPGDPTSRPRQPPTVEGLIPNCPRSQARVASRYSPAFLCNAMLWPASGRT
jgi:hypothetical protein